jgi:hypothetical protein
MMKFPRYGKIKCMFQTISQILMELAMEIAIESIGQL